MRKPKPTQEYLCNRFLYEDGRLFWKHRAPEDFSSPNACAAWNGRFAGTEAGTLSVDKKTGRKIWQIKLDYFNYRRHRLIYAMHSGEWPEEIDHRDRNSQNDSIGNLRAATSLQNKANTGARKSNSSGFKGVSWDSRKGRWLAQIRANGNKKFLGYFDTAEAASGAYEAAHIAAHGAFSNAAS